jgi:hypothetical protein
MNSRSPVSVNESFVARIPRQDKTLNAGLEIMDARFQEAPDGPDKFQYAWDSLHDDELAWIDEITYKCRYNRRFYLENFHVIRDEHGNAQTLYELWQHQEHILEIIEEKWKKDGCYRLIILKPRQIGGTAFSGAVIFHATIFTERAFTLMMAQSRKTTGELYRRIWDAYNSLPWFLRPELESKVQEDRFVFQRSDPRKRMVDPGLSSTLVISNAQEQAGVAIGKTIRAAHFSEASRWPDDDMWGADIEPSMNARDTQAIMESTPYGRRGIFYAKWIAAEKGDDEDWTPVFIPVYRVKKYYLPVRKGSGFTLTDEERSFRAKVQQTEGIVIPLGFFNWQRRKIKAYINNARSIEGLYKFQESYPSTSGEAFISSGLCAFPRRCLAEQEKINCKDPIQIGEIEYQGPELPPVLRLHAPKPEELLEKPEHENRFWLWELPDDLDTSTEYYIAADVASGTAKDFSDCTVYRLGFGKQSWVQVAEWHGKINASHFARIVAALGYWYHTAEVAVEYQGPGVTCGDELKGPIDYENIYRWKHLDKVSGQSTLHLHWMTTYRTREDMVNRMSEALLDDTIVIRNKHLIAEMRDFGRYEGEGRAEGISNNDDMVCANMIAVAASHQSGKGGANWAEEHLATRGDRATLMPSTPVVWGIYNMHGVLVDQCSTEDAGKKVIADLELKHKMKLPWTVRGIPVTRANTVWSPIWDKGSGPEHELYAEHGVEPRQMHPDLVHAYQEMYRKNGGRTPGEIGEFVSTGADGMEDD